MVFLTSSQPFRWAKVLCLQKVTACNRRKFPSLVTCCGVQSYCSVSTRTARRGEGTGAAARDGSGSAPGSSRRPPRRTRHLGTAPARPPTSRHPSRPTAWKMHLTTNDRALQNQRRPQWTGGEGLGGVRRTVDGRYVNGAVIPVDGGMTVRHT